MDAFVEVCHSFGVPVWVSPLLCAASRLRSDRARRRKVYRLMQRTLVRHHVGVSEEGGCPPTYVYPEQVKMLIRAVFPQEVCNYADPSHPQVVYLTMEDLHKVNLS